MIAVIDQQAGGPTGRLRPRRAPCAARVVLLHAAGLLRRRAAGDHHRARARTPRVSRDSVFKFIEAELNAARTAAAGAAARRAVRSRHPWRGGRDAREPLPERRRVHEGSGDQRDRIQLVQRDTVSGGETACQAAVEAADRVINSGVYSLASRLEEQLLPEQRRARRRTSSSSVHTAAAGLGMSLPMRTLHYNQLSTGNGGPWNGFATLAETYNAFDTADKRREMLLVGQQFSFQNRPADQRSGREPAHLHAGDRATIEQADEAEGVALQQVPAARQRAERRWAPERLPVVPPGRDVPDQGRGAERAGADGAGARAGEPGAGTRSSARRSRSRGLCRRGTPRRDLHRASVRVRRRGEAAAGHDPSRALHRSAALQGAARAVSRSSSRSRRRRSRRNPKLDSERRGTDPRCNGPRAAREAGCGAPGPCPPPRRPLAAVASSWLRRSSASCLAHDPSRRLRASRAVPRARGLLRRGGAATPRSGELPPRATKLFTRLPSSYTGVAFENRLTETRELNVFTYRNYYNGGGVAIGDLTGDALPEIVLTANAERPAALPQSRASSASATSRRLRGSRRDGGSWTTGVTLADVNGDGRLDIYV